MLDTVETMMLEPFDREQRDEVRASIYESSEARERRERLERMVAQSKLNTAARAMR